MSATDTSLGLAPAGGASSQGAAVLARFALPLIVFFGLMAGLLLQSSKLLNDADSLWHVEIGRWIIANGRIPRVDTFSHTFSGAPWIAKEWLSQLILFAAHEAAGWKGVAIVTAIAISGSFAWLAAWHARRLRWTAAMGAIAAGLVLALPQFLARPHMLVLPVIVVWMTTLIGALDKKAAPPLWLALLMPLWVNMHGSFPLGLVMAGVFACEGVLLQPAGMRALRGRQWALFLALSALGTIVSPYGLETILVPLQMPSNGEALQYVGEWQPLGLDETGCIALGLMALTFGVLLRDARANVFRILALAMMSYLMIRHVRFTGLFGIIAPLLAARTLSANFGFGAEPDQPAQAGLVKIAAGVAAAALALAVVVSPKPNPEMSPDTAFHFAMDHGVTGPVYNDYDFGGYLIAHQTRTFVDGRTDQLFLGPFLPALYGALDKKDNAPFATILETYHASWALVRPQSKDAAHFAAMQGWSKLYEDEIAAVFVRG